MTAPTPTARTTQADRDEWIAALDALDHANTGHTPESVIVPIRGGQLRAFIADADALARAEAERDVLRDECDRRRSLYRADLDAARSHAEALTAERDGLREAAGPWLAARAKIRANRDAQAAMEARDDYDGDLMAIGIGEQLEDGIALATAANALDAALTVPR